jgi:hypothetical protein
MLRETRLPSRISISTVPSASAIPRRAWDRLCPAGHPFLNADFLTIIEEHGAAAREWGWAARHLVASDASGAVVGLLPLYLKTHSHGDFIYDWSWAAAYRQLGRQYYPKLMSCLPHTPVAGPRLLVAAGPQAAGARQALLDGARALLSSAGLSSWHVALPADAEARMLQSEGLLISHDVQFHWINPGCGDFDGYLASFSAAKRRKVRAERRRVQESGLAIEIRHGDQIDPAEWPLLHALYADTFEKFNNHAVFSAACFADSGDGAGSLHGRSSSLAITACRWPWRSVFAATKRSMDATGAAAATTTACTSNSASTRASPIACSRDWRASSPAPAASTSCHAASRRPPCILRTGSPIRKCAPCLPVIWRCRAGAGRLPRAGGRALAVPARSVARRQPPEVAKRHRQESALLAIRDSRRWRAALPDRRQR